MTKRTASSSWAITISGWALSVVPTRVCPLREYPMKRQKCSRSRNVDLWRTFKALRADAAYSSAHWRLPRGSGIPAGGESCCRGGLEVLISPIPRSPWMRRLSENPVRPATPSRAHAPSPRSPPAGHRSSRLQKRLEHRLPPGADGVHAEPLEAAVPGRPSHHRPTGRVDQKAGHRRSHAGKVVDTDHETRLPIRHDRTDTWDVGGDHRDAGQSGFDEYAGHPLAL